MATTDPNQLKKNTMWRTSFMSGIVSGILSGAITLFWTGVDNHYANSMVAVVVISTFFVVSFVVATGFMVRNYFKKG